jgi:hypothetical protein
MSLAQSAMKKAMIPSIARLSFKSVSGMQKNPLKNIARFN